MKRNVLFFILILLLILPGCSPSSAQQPAPPVTDTESVQVNELTLDDLAKYNGKDGAKAYIAVDGVVYDVTDVPPWAGGIHQDKYQAGIDASSLIEQSPHGKKVLEKLPVVGKIKQ